MPAPPGSTPVASARRNHVSEAETSVSHALGTAGPPGMRRPPAETEGQDVAGSGRTCNLPRSIRDRRDAALRLAPFCSLWGLPGRDPLCPEREPSPSSFGLRRAELEAEVARCREAGWSADELRERFIDPRTVGAA